MTKELATEQVSKPECSDCGSTNLQLDDVNKELVCQVCGLVNEDEMIDRGVDWRAYNRTEEYERSHIGDPITNRYHDKGLTTSIGIGRFQGKTGGEETRLRKLQSRSRTSNPSERTLRNNLLELEAIVAQMEIPKHIHEDAAILFRQAYRHSITRGKKAPLTAAACIYGACRQHNQPRALDDFSNTLNVPRKDIGKAWRVLSSTLKLGIAPAGAKELYPRFIAQFKDMPKELIGPVSIMLDTIEKKNYANGKAPAGTVAAVIFLAAEQSGNRIPQTVIAEALGITEMTIRHRSRELRTLLDI